MAHLAKTGQAAVLAALLVLLFGCQHPETVRPSAGVTTLDSTNYRFTQSKIELAQQWQHVLPQLEDVTVRDLQEAGGKIYSIWHPIPLQEGAPSSELTPRQLLLTVAWPRSEWATASEVVDASIRKLPAVTSVRTRLLEPIAMPGGIPIPTGEGFYVHRLNRYASDNVAKVVQLSQAAWVLMRTAYRDEHSVVALFREVPDHDGVATLERIVWYPSFEGWKKTRGAKEQVPEAIRLFEERGQMAIGNPYGEGTVTGRVVDWDQGHKQGTGGSR